MEEFKEVKLMIDPSCNEFWYEGTHFKITNLMNWTKTEVFRNVGKKGKVKWEKIDQIIDRIVIEVCVNHPTYVTITFVDGITKKG